MNDDYKFLVAKGSDKLSEKVNKALEDGYELAGSPTMSACYLGMDEEGIPQTLVLCGQAVIKYED